MMTKKRVNLNCVIFKRKVGEIICLHRLVVLPLIFQAKLSIQKISLPQGRLPQKIDLKRLTKIKTHHEADEYESSILASKLQKKQLRGLKLSYRNRSRYLLLSLNE